MTLLFFSFFFLTASQVCDARLLHLDLLFLSYSFLSPYFFPLTNFHVSDCVIYTFIPFFFLLSFLHVLSLIHPLLLISPKPLHTHSTSTSYHILPLYIPLINLDYCKHEDTSPFHAAAPHSLETHPLSLPSFPLTPRTLARVVGARLS